MDTPMLPNGIPYGICFDGIDNYSQKAIRFYREIHSLSNLYKYARFTKNLRIVTSYYNTEIENVHITDIFNKGLITGYICDYCNKIHIIRFYSKKNEK
jgi:hypothetical protein